MSIHDRNRGLNKNETRDIWPFRASIAINCARCNCAIPPFSRKAMIRKSGRGSGEYKKRMEGTKTRVGKKGKRNKGEVPKTEIKIKGQGKK